MQIIHRLLVLLFLLPGNALFAEEKSGESGLAPDALVTALYQQHDQDLGSVFNQTENRTSVDRFFDKRLAELIWKDAVEANGEVGALGADPLYDAQDTEIKDFEIGAPKISGAKASVTVSFKNFGKKQKIVFSLLLKNDEWKITDLKYADGRTLVGMLKEGQ